MKEAKNTPPRRCAVMHGKVVLGAVPAVHPCSLLANGPHKGHGQQKKCPEQRQQLCSSC